MHETGHRVSALVSVLIGISLLTGCAQIKHKPVQTFDDACGIPYYLGSWYLLTYPDGHGSLAAQYYFLRDPKRKMVAEPRAWFARLDTTLTFKDGVLSSSKTTADSTAVPAALIQGAEAFLKALAAADEPLASSPLSAPSIFKVRVDSPTQITFLGEASPYTVSVAGWGEVK